MFARSGSTRYHNALPKKAAGIAPPNTLTDSYIPSLSKVQPYLNFMTQTPKYKPHFITLPKYTVLINSRVVYAILLLC